MSSNTQTEHEYEYCNCATEKEPRFGEVSYMVAGGGMMNGNAYATIELKDGLYYSCEYGKYPWRRCVGNKIVWSDEIYDKKEPYECRNFDILDEEEEVVIDWEVQYYVYEDGEMVDDNFSQYDDEEEAISRFDELVAEDKYDEVNVVFSYGDNANWIKQHKKIIT